MAKLKPIPYVSVIISAFESENVIGGCLESLRRQTYKNFEVVIVNSSADTKTRREVKRVFPSAKFFQYEKRLLPQDAKGLGITKARGNLFAFIDPDCRARPDWLEILVNQCETGKVFVGGALENHYPSWMERGIHLCKFHDVLKGLSAGPIWIIPFSNACLTREVWEKIGPFKPDLYSSDGLLCWHARDMGITPWFEPEAIVEHIHGNNIFSFMRVRFGRGAEFSVERIAYERWSRKRIEADLFLTPLRITWVLVRCARNALKSGKGSDFLFTFPIQILGQAAWILGEAVGLKRVLGKKRAPRQN